MHEAKEYLLKLYADEIRLTQLEEQYKRVRSEAVGLKSPRLDGMRVQGSGDGYAGKLSGLLEVEQKLEARYCEIAEERARIIDEIQALDNVHHIRLLYLRYIKHKRLEEIALEMCFSYPHIKRLHGEALDEFKRKHL